MRPFTIMRCGLALLLTLCGVAHGLLVEWPLETHRLFSTSRANGRNESVEFLQPTGHYGGYFAVNGTEDGHLFYLYFENRYQNDAAPLVLWTNGGPGCSSLYGLFMENGPYQILDDLTLCWSDYGWDIGHNLLFVDHPLDVGYSYGSPLDQVTKDAQVAQHMLEFFYAFYEKHPELQMKPLYLTGESYAGHYIPAIANRIVDANAEATEFEIPLAGIAIGDPWTHPELQFRAYPLYGYQMGLISAEQRDEMMQNWKFCQYDLQICHPEHPDFSELACVVGYDFCNDAMFLPILYLNPGLNYYDIRTDCPVDGCYDVTNLNAFMNQPHVREMFSVPRDLEWKDCSDDVYFAMLWECSIDSTAQVERLLNMGLPTLIYVGDQDLICNYLGVRDFVESMQWSGTEAWKNAEMSIWTVNGERAGEIQSAGVLTYLQVDQSGHMVPYDQPVAALEMLEIFTRSAKKTWTTQPHPQIQIYQDKT